MQVGIYYQGPGEKPIPIINEDIATAQERIDKYDRVGLSGNGRYIVGPRIDFVSNRPKPWQTWPLWEG